MRALEPLLRANEQRIETEQTLPRPVVDALLEAGVFRTHTPKAVGGLEVDVLTFFEVVEELSRINGSVGWLAMINCGNFLSWYPQPISSQLFRSATPHAVFSGNLAPKGRAVVAPGGYRVSGRWAFVSGCPHADWILLRSSMYDGERPRLNAQGEPEVVAGVFRFEDVEILPTWSGLGLRGTGSHDVVVADVFLPEEHVTRMEDHYPGPLYKAWFFLLGHAAHAVGIGRAALQAVIDLAHLPHAPRAGGLATRPEVQMALAEAEATLQSARSFVWDIAARSYAQAEATGSIETDLRMLLKLSMTHAVRSSAHAVKLVFDAAGPPSVYEGTQIERCFRDIHTATQHSLMQTVHYQPMGEYLFSRHLPALPPGMPRRAII